MSIKTCFLLIAAAFFIHPGNSWGQAANIDKWISLLNDNSSLQAFKRQEAFNLIEKQDTAAIIRTAEEIQKATSDGSRRMQLIGKAVKAKLLFYFQLPHDSVQAAHMKECLLEAAKLDEPYLEAEYSRSYAEMLASLKNKALAVQYGMSSLRIHEQLGIERFPTVSSFYMAVGELLYQTINDRDAVNYLLKGVELSAKDTVPYFLKIFAYNNLGLAYKKLKMYDSGLYYYQKCIDFSRINNRPDWVDNASNNRYDCYIGLAQYDSAEAIGNRMLKDGLASKDEFAEMIGSWMLGHSLLSRNEYNQSLPHLLQVKKLVDKLNFKQLASFINKDLATCYEALGQADKAYVFLKAYKQLDDSLQRVKAQSTSKYLHTKAMFDEEQFKIKQLEAKRKRQINIRNISIVSVVLLAGLALWWLNKKRRKASQLQKEAEGQLMNFKEDIIQKNDKIEALLAEINTRQDQEQQAERVAELSRQMILTEDDWLHFKSLFEKSHPGFFNTLRQKATDITEAEMRMAALIKLQLNTKQMAAMQGIGAESIHKNRQRLRQRLALNSTEEMEALLHSI